MSKKNELVIPHTPLHEQAVFAAALVSEEHRGVLLDRFAPDAFQEEAHRVGWRALHEMRRRGLAYDPATFATIVKGVQLEYFQELAEIRSEPPPNLAHHCDALDWDRQRLGAARGPVAALLAALQDAEAAPERVRALARNVSEAFQGGVGAGRWLRDPHELVAENMRDLEERVEGRATRPYGIDGLDLYEAGAVDAKGRDIGGTPRLIPGMAPGLITMLAGESGSGKSTTAARIAIGQARLGRRGLYCAWEPQAGMTLELMATISLGWSRTCVILGRDVRDVRSKMPPAQRVKLEERQHALSRHVVFMDNPFRRQRAEKMTNANNLDVFQEHLAACGGHWAIADLWERCLEETRPDDEKRALQRQQAMMVEQDQHLIILAQHNKESAKQEDKRPTKASVAGTGAWVQITDALLATYRPGQWKSVDDDTIEIHVLKQRWGAFPLTVAFDWDGDRGSMTNGRSVPYEHPGQGGGIGGVEDMFKAPELGKKRR